MGLNGFDLRAETTNIVGLTKDLDVQGIYFKVQNFSLRGRIMHVIRAIIHNFSSTEWICLVHLNNKYDQLN